MTSRRPRNFLTALLAACSIALLTTGCAALPEDAPVIEQLDEETGLTIKRLGHPMELYRETFQRDPAGRFAFLAPFETNRMGARELYLWISLPVDLAPGSEPEIELDGRALPLGKASRESEIAGLSKSPYKIPTPWSAMFYYKIDEEVLSKLADATTLTARISEQSGDGTIITVFASTVADSRLKDFAAR